MDFKIDDPIDILIKGARVMYTTPDHSEGAATLTTVLHRGTRYVLLAEPGQVIIVKPRGDEPAETSTAAPETRVSDERVEAIVGALNAFVVREYEGGTEIVAGSAIPVRTLTGCDPNLDHAVDWARKQVDVAGADGPLLGHANVQLVDGTLIDWEPERSQWAVTVSDDTDECDTQEVSDAGR